MTQLTAHDLTLTISNRTFVENFSAEFKPGEIWGIFGSNGTGKTTLLHTLCGLRQPNKGYLSLNNQILSAIKLKERAKKIGLLFQDTHFPFPSTVLESVLIGRFPYQTQWLCDHTDDVEMAMNALKRVNLDSLSHRNAQTLSGGEKRRLSLATLLVQNPDIFLLDEPTNHLDIEQQFQLLEILKTEAKENNKTIIMVLHNLPYLQHYCEKLIVFDYLPNFCTGSSHELLTQLRQHKPQLFQLFDAGVK